jgi:hypothetical protein
MVQNRGIQSQFRDQALAITGAASPTLAICPLQCPYCRSLGQSQALLPWYLVVDSPVFHTAVTAHVALDTAATAVIVAANYNISIQTTIINLPICHGLSNSAITTTAQAEKR